MTFGKIITGKRVSVNEIDEDLKLITLFLINTIAFVLEGYYINPYYQIE